MRKLATGCGNLGVSKWTFSGMTTPGIHPEMKGIDLLEFRGGKIVPKNSYWKIIE